MDIVQISGSLYWMISKSEERVICFSETTFFQIPPWTLWTEIYLRVHHQIRVDILMKYIKLTPQSRGRAGIKAEPICNLIGLQTSYSKDTFNSYRHAISPVLSTAKLAQNPKKRPKAVQSCQALIATMQIRTNNGSKLYNTYSLQEILELVQENSQQQRSEPSKLWNPFQYQVKDE